jgi:hypothetical protein
MCSKRRRLTGWRVLGTSEPRNGVMTGQNTPFRWDANMTAKEQQKNLWNKKNRIQSEKVRTITHTPPSCRFLLNLVFTFFRFAIASQLPKNLEVLSSKKVSRFAFRLWVLACSASHYWDSVPIIHSIRFYLHLVNYYTKAINTTWCFLLINNLIHSSKQSTW